MLVHCIVHPDGLFINICSTHTYYVHELKVLITSSYIFGLSAPAEAAANLVNSNCCCHASYD